MSYEMDANGKWHKKSTGKISTTTSTSTNKQKTKASKGNTSDTKKGIKISDSNASDNKAYAEETSFTMEGNYNVRMGTTLRVRDGVAERWKGNWKIIETTHTVDSKGYKIDGKAGRIPYKTEDKKKKKTKKSKKKTSTNNNSSPAKQKTSNTSSSSSSKHYYKMDANGKWHAVSK